MDALRRAHAVTPLACSVGPGGLLGVVPPGREEPSPVRGSRRGWKGISAAGAAPEAAGGRGAGGEQKGREPRWRRREPALLTARRGDGTLETPTGCARPQPGAGSRFVFGD